MKLSGWIDFESVRLQASVDLIHPLRALLDEADVECPGIPDFGCPIEVGQGQYHAVLVPQEGDLVIARLPLRIEPEVLHQEAPGLLDVRDGEIEVVQDHGKYSAGLW